MVLSHYTLDCLSPINPSESGIGAGGGQVGWIRVQPHRVSKDKKPILDYDSSNDDFEEQDFDDFAVSPEQGLVDDFTIVTQENSGQFSRVTGGRHGM